ncbi:4-hydroxythreonine-4-phosphate dehydrogenase PdxA [Candidatus Pelagibacter sp.]|nr:4-hydroxythreonine-4-phosphate dehydrogenase PdxA [Candidatus Pelagibacter sp.]
MKSKPILIVAGEPNSIFLEIFFKSIKTIKIKNPIILICSKKLFLLQSKALNKKIKFKLVSSNDILEDKVDNKIINLLNVDLSVKKPFNKISNKYNNYIEKCFNTALKLIKKGISYKLINGPISKKHFLQKKFHGITEYLAKKTNTKKYAMLIYNKKLSVCPVTTHLPVRQIHNKITKIEIINKVALINIFFKKYFNFYPNFAVTGLNPHCESINEINEDEKILAPTIKKLNKSKYKIAGPFAADTLFMKKNRDKFNVIIGMYHDQVLTPIKTLFEYDAINITVGLPFIRVSPDHGPNEKMLGKNLSSPLSLIRAIEFLDKN